MAKDEVKAIVIGAAGRMGHRILAAIHESSQVRLVGAVEREDHPSLGRDAGEVAGMAKWDVPLVGELRDAIGLGDVIIDFTHAESSLKNLQVAAEKRKSAVIGSTGFTSEQMKEVQSLVGKIPCVLSPLPRCGR